MKLSLVWRATYEYSAQTDPTLVYTRNVKDFMNAGTMPKATQLDLQDAYIMQLIGMERWGNRTLVMRDVAGEYFNKLHIPIKHTPYLIHVPTTIMLFSLHDLKESTFTMDELMNGYIQTLLLHDRNFQQTPRTIIVVLSKADLLLSELPANLKDYLLADPFSGILQSQSVDWQMGNAEMTSYMQKLNAVSGEIKDWIDKDSFGHTMIMRASHNNIHLKFSIVSSTGSPVPDDKKMKVDIRPIRILDPFFWILDLQSRPG
jgi:hypothetical protein